MWGSENEADALGVALEDRECLDEAHPEAASIAVLPGIEWSGDVTLSGQEAVTWRL